MEQETKEIAMTPELAAIFPTIDALSEPAKRELLTVLIAQLKNGKKQAEPKVEPKTEETDDEPFVYDPNNPSLGLFYDEPELVDEVLRLAMEMRGRRYEESK